MFIQKKKNAETTKMVKILLTSLFMGFGFLSETQGCRKYGFWHKVLYCCCRCRCPRNVVLENNFDYMSATGRPTYISSSINDETEDQPKSMLERLKIYKKSKNGYVFYSADNHHGGETDNNDSKIHEVVPLLFAEDIESSAPARNRSKTSIEKT